MGLLDREARNAKAVLMERGHTKSDVARRPAVSEGTRSPSRPPDAGGGGRRPLSSARAAGAYAATTALRR